MPALSKQIPYTTSEGWSSLDGNPGVTRGIQIRSWHGDVVEMVDTADLKSAGLCLASSSLAIPMGEIPLIKVLLYMNFDKAFILEVMPLLFEKRKVIDKVKTSLEKGTLTADEAIDLYPETKALANMSITEEELISLIGEEELRRREKLALHKFIDSI